MDYSNFQHGAALYFSQFQAMLIKKILYSSRNYILLLIQLLIPALFIVITMATAQATSGDKDLPELAISLNEYLDTVTVMHGSNVPTDSEFAPIVASYQAQFALFDERQSFNTTNRNFEDAILDQYRVSTSDTNLKYMVGASFNASAAVAWFNNQAYHTAPLAINLVNNAILKGFGGSDRAINIVNKPLPFILESRVRICREVLYLRI